MRWALALLCAVLVSACGPGADERSGGDHERSSAVDVPFGEVIADRVSEDDGDATDWKRFALDRPAQVNVALHWDDKDVEARIELRDRYGKVVAKKGHQEGKSSEVLSAQLEAGEYFLSIRAEGAGSVYALELSTGEFAGPLPAPGEMLAPGQEPRPE